MLALDAHFIPIIGGQLKHYNKARGDLLAAVNEMARYMFEEIDYIHEAHSAERFAFPCDFDADQKSSLKNYGVRGSTDKRGKSTANYGSQGEGKSQLKVPKIYWDFTWKYFLSMEWTNGVKLIDKEGIKAHLDAKKLVDMNIYCSSRQVLKEGYFHVGNLVATSSGSLTYLEIAMQIIFVAMQASYGDEATKSQLDFQGIMNQLFEVTYSTIIIFLMNILWWQELWDLWKGRRGHLILTSKL